MVMDEGNTGSADQELVMFAIEGGRVIDTAAVVFQRGLTAPL